MRALKEYFGDEKTSVMGIVLLVNAKGVKEVKGA